MTEAQRTAVAWATADQKREKAEKEVSRLIDRIARAREILMADPTPTSSTREAVDELEKALWQYSNAKD